MTAVAKYGWVKMIFEGCIKGKDEDMKIIRFLFQYLA